MKERKFFIEVLKAGNWHRTWWTTEPDNPEIKPNTRKVAEKKMKRAQSRFPYATYRIVEALEESMNS